ncbi:PE-PGRS family protein [Streptomyces sp. SID12488]|uniref:PE-PGRS family protein n=1 Tax=Streptomyces sp. SID12488 TaxID=2706040 RepID=UPI001EF3BF71|nr:PE-PGRS family protein [Streptomyces sp. SID12488]
MTGGRDQFVELLQHAGLETVGDWHIEEVLPPRAAWRPVVSGRAKPFVAVPADQPDLVAELNAQWHRLAGSIGILGEDGVFLIDVAGNWSGCAPRRWARVKLSDEWDLAGVLGKRPGQPEFLSLSTDGNTLIGVTTEEDEVWFIVLDRIGEWQEATARAAAQETAEEREAAWVALFRGPGPSERLRQMWVHGLALNPAAPDDLRSRLLGLSHHGMWRPLPTAVIEAAMVHPDPKLRQHLAEVQPNITTDQWVRLILGEEESRNRWILTLLAAERQVELTDAAYEQLVADPSARIRGEAARLAGLPVRILTALVADAEWSVRAAVCRRAWPHLGTAARRALLDDPSGKVRIEALLQHHQEHPMPRSAFDTTELDAAELQGRAVKTCCLERPLAEHLTHHGDQVQRCSLAGNPHLDPDLVGVLAQDPDERVRSVVALRADLTEEQRADIDIDFNPRIHHRPLDWVVALHEDPVSMRRLAASSHPFVRRSVARARHLPPDVIEVLAHDEDRVVQALPRGILRRRTRGHAAEGVAVVDRKPQHPRSPPRTSELPPRRPALLRRRPEPTDAPTGLGRPGVNS